MLEACLKGLWPSLPKCHQRRSPGGEAQRGEGWTPVIAERGSPVSEASRSQEPKQMQWPIQPVDDWLATDHHAPPPGQPLSLSYVLLQVYYPLSLLLLYYFILLLYYYVYIYINLVLHYTKFLRMYIIYIYFYTYTFRTKNFVYTHIYLKTGK